MVVLIALPFAALIIAILVIRLMRSIRGVSDLQDQRRPMTLPAEHRRASDDYHDQTWLPLCERVAAAAGAKLARPLTAKERRTIWRARTDVALEAIHQEIADARDADAVMELLARIPSGLDRPDPTGWCGQNA